MEDIREVVKTRFPNAQFLIYCFNSIDEIENKILNDTDEYIIYADKYIIQNKDLFDFYIVQRKPNQNCIYYKDVIDCMIENGFNRNDCDYSFMKDIDRAYEPQNNLKSVKVYASIWGSLNHIV